MKDSLIEVAKAVVAEADKTGGSTRRVSRYEIDRLRQAIAADPLNAINDAGAREKSDGTTVLQFKSRSQQLNSIAEDLGSYLRNRKAALDDEDDAAEYKEVHGLIGACEQLGIIADELKRAGK